MVELTQFPSTKISRRARVGLRLDPGAAGPLPQRADPPLTLPITNNLSPFPGAIGVRAAQS